MNPALHPPARSGALHGEHLDFAQAAPCYSYLQDPDWPAYAPKRKRHSYLWAGVRGADGGLCLTGVLRRTALAAGYWQGSFRRGPLTATPQDLQPALKALLPLLRARGCTALTLNPRWTGADCAAAEAAMAAAGAAPAPPGQQTLHSVTGLIDLTASYDDILQRFSRTTRQSIAKLGRIGFTARLSEDAADIALYGEWLRSFYASRNMDAAGQPSAEAQAAFVRDKGGILATAWHKGEKAGVFVLFRDGDRLIPIGNGWADPKSRLPRSYLLIDAAIRIAKERMPGIRWLDLGGLSGPGEDGPAGAQGRDAFKMRFAPEIIQMPQVHRIVLRPAIDRLAQTIRNRGKG